MTKRNIKMESLNSVMSSSPSTPTRDAKQRKHNFATPTSHHIDDDTDQDTSPYSLSYSQRAGAEVTWGKRRTPVPSKSKSKPYVPPDTPPSVTSRYFENDDEKPKTPRGFFKHKKTLERMGFANLERNTEIVDDKIGSSDSTSDSNFITALEDVGARTSNLNDSTNLQQLLDDSIDMELIQLSQQIEQDVSRIEEPIDKPIASKGFVDGLDSTDDDSLFDDLLLLDENVLMQKSILSRHKSISTYPTTSSKPNSSCPKTGSNNVISAITRNSVVSTQASSSAQSPPSKPFSRHKSMPSPSVRASMKQCSPEEIEFKRQQAIAKLQKFKLKKK